MSGISLKGFAEFARIKSETESHFRYFDFHNCAFAQYLKSLGYENPCVNGDGYWPDIKNDLSYMISFNTLHPDLWEVLADSNDDWRILADKLEELARDDLSRRWDATLDKLDALIGDNHE